MSRPNAMLMAKHEAERKLKEGISGHRTGLPKKLLELFGPLEPLGGLTRMKHRKPAVPYTGMGQYLAGFAQPGDEEYEPEQKPDRPDSPRRFRNPELKHQARVEQESKLEKRIRVVADKEESAKQDIEDGLQDWDASKDPNAAGDGFKTLFVARISFDVTEKKLRKEFEEYGPIKRIRLVHDKNTDKPKGYAFIEYEHKNDMKNAYKVADGRKLEGRRITVDVERGRTVPGWRPRRFGGGKGGEGRLPKEPKNPSKRLAAGLSLTPGLPAPPAAGGALPPPPRERPREERPPPGPPAPAPRERERERDRGLPPPPSKDRDSQRDRERERLREGERPRESERHRDRDREGAGRDKDRERERPPSDRHDRDRGDRSERKRDREADGDRSSKRARDDDRGTRRRERDHV